MSCKQVVAVAVDVLIHSGCKIFAVVHTALVHIAAVGNHPHIV